jgi:dethiobiotin synthetase
MRGLFVTGTGTGVGKTILSAALLAAMRAAGEQVAAHKPVVTGLDEPPVGPLDPSPPGQPQPGHPPGDHPQPGHPQPGHPPGDQWPPDHELLGLAAAMRPAEVAPLRYGPAVSPHLAGALAGERIDPARLIANARTAMRRAAADGRALIVEGVGGLLVPLTDDFTVRDLAVELGLPVVIAAPPGLGTINHTLLTLEAARHAGLEVRAVVLTPWPERPSTMERSNRETISRLGAIDVYGLSCVQDADVRVLAAAGERLPWRSWVG